MSFAFLKQWHTWVVVLIAVSSALSAITGYLPSDWAATITTILSVIAIVVHQNS